MKIDKLTEEQNSQLEVWRDKWIRTGFDTRSCNREKVEALVKDLYGNADPALMPPKTILWADSPWHAVDIITKKYDISKQDCFNAFCYGQHDASWLGFYEYFSDVVGLEEQCQPVKPLIAIAKEVGWFLPFDEVICFCERPEEINLITEDGKTHCIKNEKPDDAIINGVAHKDGGMAIRFRDGQGSYILHGVEVTEKIAVTPWNELDPSLILTTDNAEVRREIVRKIGVERIAEELNAEVLDKEGDYELLSLDLTDGRKRPYLKMLNPSIGVYHIEGVDPSIKSVKEALIWRNGTEEEPVALT